MDPVKEAWTIQMEEDSSEKEMNQMRELARLSSLYFFNAATLKSLAITKNTTELNLIC